MKTELLVERLESLKKLAKCSNFPRVKIAAAVFKGSRMVGVGVNTTKTHPLQKKYDYIHRKFETNGRLHAEFSAILSCDDKDLQGSTLYVARSLVKGSPGMCRPCPSCMALAISKGIRKIIYTTEAGICEETLC